MSAAAADRRTMLMKSSPASLPAAIPVSEEVRVRLWAASEAEDVHSEAALSEVSAAECLVAVALQAGSDRSVMPSNRLFFLVKLLEFRLLWVIWQISG